MKKLLALCFLTATMFAQSPTSAKFKWSYTYNTNYPTACTSTVTTNCIQNFVLKQDGVSVATIPATSATSYTYTLSPLPAAGTYTYTLVAVGAYQGGTIPSDPVMVSLQLPSQPSTPTGFTVVLQ